MNRNLLGERKAVEEVVIGEGKGFTVGVCDDSLDERVVHLAKVDVELRVLIISDGEGWD